LRKITEWTRADIPGQEWTENAALLATHWQQRPKFSLCRRAPRLSRYVRAETVLCRASFALCHADQGAQQRDRGGGGGFESAGS
jgi:hypothetical protein